MIINFQDIEEKILENFLGGEKRLIASFFTDENNKVLQGKLEPKASIGMHKHDTSSEFIYILKGKGIVKTDLGIEEVKEGSLHYCPKEKSHSLINNSNEDLIFLGIVPKH